MIKEITDRFVAAKVEFMAEMTEKLDGPDYFCPSYASLLDMAIRACRSDNNGAAPDPDRIHTIDDGHYQGTLVFVVASGGYQPSRYWTTRVEYGSCSGCDALEAAHCGSDRAGDYWTIALHMMQRLAVLP
jgi:hypothetical protein